MPRSNRRCQDTSFMIGALRSLIIHAERLSRFGEPLSFQDCIFHRRVITVLQIALTNPQNYPFMPLIINVEQANGCTSNASQPDEPDLVGRPSKVLLPFLLSRME